MTYAYTTGSRRRLVLGPPQAPARLCVPIPLDAYDVLAALPERDQEMLVQGWVEWLTHVVQVWQPPEPERETAAERDAQRQLGALEEEGLAARERREREHEAGEAG